MLCVEIRVKSRDVNPFLMGTVTKYGTILLLPSSTAFGSPFGINAGPVFSASLCCTHFCSTFAYLTLSHFDILTLLVLMFLIHNGI